jgi:hypothetical protein
MPRRVLSASPISSFHRLSFRLFCVRPSSGNVILRPTNQCRNCKSADEGIPAAVCFCHSLVFIVVARWNSKIELFLGDVGVLKAGRCRSRALSLVLTLKLFQLNYVHNSS